MRAVAGPLAAVVVVVLVRALRTDRSSGSAEDRVVEGRDGKGGAPQDPGGHHRRRHRRRAAARPAPTPARRGQEEDDSRDDGAIIIILLIIVASAAAETGSKKRRGLPFRSCRAHTLDAICALPPAKAGHRHRHRIQPAKRGRGVHLLLPPPLPPVVPCKRSNGGKRDADYFKREQVWWKRR